VLRKSIIALAAVATIGAAAIAPTEASARGFHYRHAGRIALGTAIVLTTAAIASSCWRYRWYRGVYVRQWVCD
jgi:hypothetical protein